MSDLPAPPGSLSDAEIRTWEGLCTRIVALKERAWEHRISGRSVANWLRNFDGRTGIDTTREQLHALYLLSQFMYFGSREIRVLLRSMYRDLFLVPMLQEIQSAKPQLDDAALLAEFRKELAATRFMGVGNPSESGVHLLYFFRQENELSKQNFMDAAQLYVRKKRWLRWVNQVRHPEVKRYIFLDDLCGTGETAKRYSENLLPDLVRASPGVDLRYLALFACSDGLLSVQRETVFGSRSQAVFELDDSYKATHAGSRYLAVRPAEIDASVLRDLALTYGTLVWPDHPTGYLDSQLLIGFSHNTPDNTFPIMWSDPQNGSPCAWTPMFKRYPKN